jgi:hypothetical protein
MKDFFPSQTQIENAKKNCHSYRMNQGAKEKLIEMALTALQYNPQLTKSQFVASLTSKDTHYSAKTVRTYLCNIPFHATKARYTTRGKRIEMAYEHGYETAMLGKQFHQTLPVYQPEPELEENHDHIN